MALPTINFSEEKDPGQVIHQSLSSIGFMQLKEFGIDQGLLRQVFEESRTFFGSDAGAKTRCNYRSATENFGYQGLLQENLDPTSPADLKETFTMRNILHACLSDDRWPSDSFKVTMTQFYNNVLDCVFRVQREMAKQLEVAEDYFSSAHSGQNITLRLLYYPAQTIEQVKEQQLGAGAHTDYGFMTFVFQDSVGGLQVLDCEDKWIDVPPSEDAAVVNCGDLLERWTNGVYRSTLHRVKPSTTGRARYSIAFFIDPDSDTEVSPLSSCITDNNPCQFATVTAGKHIQDKLDASHKERFVQQS